jgi:hypothetical protein
MTPSLSSALSCDKQEKEVPFECLIVESHYELTINKQGKNLTNCI